ncbi:MAG TPA: hypothetical protein VFU19_18700 [Iamia sp.]|nr:hypothetical protein [Iamia sp.]
MTRVKRLLIGAAMALLLGLVRVLAGPDVVPVGAAGDTFEVAHYNLCSRKCSLEHVPGASKTHLGVTPVNEMFWWMAARNRFPRAISLNEVCGEAFWTLAAGLDPSYNYKHYFLASRNFPNDGGCTTFGNSISARTLTDYGPWQYCHVDGNGGTASNGCAPSTDTGAEYRNMVCTRSQVYFEGFWACTSHTTGSGQATDYRAVIDYWTDPRVALGDLNVQDSVQSFTDNGYADAYVGLPTIESGDHIDYAYFHTGNLAGRDSYFRYNGASDHHLLFGGIHFK